MDEFRIAILESRSLKKKRPKKGAVIEQNLKTPKKSLKTPEATLPSDRILCGVNDWNDDIVIDGAEFESKGAIVPVIVDDAEISLEFVKEAGLPDIMNDSEIPFEPLKGSVLPVIEEDSETPSESFKFAKNNRENDIQSFGSNSASVNKYIVRKEVPAHKYIVRNENVLVPLQVPNLETTEIKGGHRNPEKMVRKRSLGEVDLQGVIEENKVPRWEGKGTNISRKNHINQASRNNVDYNTKEKIDHAGRSLEMRINESNVQEPAQFSHHHIPAAPFSNVNGMPHNLAAPHSNNHESTQFLANMTLFAQQQQQQAYQFYAHQHMMYYNMMQMGMAASSNMNQHTNYPPQLMAPPPPMFQFQQEIHQPRTSFLDPSRFNPEILEQARLLVALADQFDQHHHQ